MTRIDHGGSAGFSRRGFLSKGSVTAIVATSAVPALATGTPDGDVGIFALGRDYDAARARYQASFARLMEAEERYSELRPICPEEIKRPLGRIIAPVSKSHSMWTAEDFRYQIQKYEKAIASYGNQAWCSREDISLLRELLPLAEQFEAAVAMADEKSQLAYWEKQNDEDGEAASLICRAALLTPATTPAGFAEKMRLIKEWIQPEWWREWNTPEEEESGEPSFRRILPALMLENAMTLLGCGEAA